MISNDSLYGACRELFACYPHAIRQVSTSGSVVSMVVMLLDCDQAGFFVLSQDSRGDRPSYLLWPWPAGDIVNIAAEAGTIIADVVIDVVHHGVRSRETVPCSAGCAMALSRR
jgi:hypothetical protein